MEPIKFTEKTMTPIGEEYEIDFNGTPVKVHDFDVTGEDNVTRREMGMTYKSIADLLGYARPCNVGRLVSREIREFLGCVYNPNIIGVRQTDGPPKRMGSMPIYLVGSGIDKFMMFTKKPLGTPYRDWLADRALDLRTNGAALAHSRMPEVKPITQESALQVPDSLQEQGVMIALLTSMHTTSLKAAQDISRNTEIATIAHAMAEDSADKVETMQKELDCIKRRNDAAVMQFGEIKMTALARKCMILSDSGRPHGGCMGLLWSKFDMRGQGFTRKFIDDVGQERPYEIEILTKEGHEYFMEYVLPTIPFGKSRIDPSEEDRKRGVRGYSIYRVELTQI